MMNGLEKDQARYKRLSTRGTRNNPTRDGRSAAVACHRGWNVYGKLQGRGRKRSSPRCCTTSASICCVMHFWRSRSALHRGWTALRGGTTRQTWRAICRPCTGTSTQAVTERSPSSEGSFRSLTATAAAAGLSPASTVRRTVDAGRTEPRAQCALQGSRRWKTRSSSARWRLSSTRFTSKIS